MQRYILNNETKKFSENDIHHIKNVMRMKENDLVVVCYENQCYQAKLIFNDNKIDYEIIKELPKKDTLDITLIQGSLKGSKIETTIKYATIFGARTIIITEFERSIAKLKNSDYKLNRYNQIAKEAAELSKRNNITNIEFANNLSKIDYGKYDLVILADEEEKELTLSNLDLSKIKSQKLAIIIGPEGGITNNERKLLEKQNVEKITLGEYIYPAEIASLKLLANLSHISFDN
ncbi:MAG TPA: 16S rRNA (uracil(1498)-N(3))-methyltransferase [Acholeplasma sp.]|nr:16S rRNA (uracil(1498)-N(3))-methyltransferase [Acholeplasma sp.]